MNSYKKIVRSFIKIVNGEQKFADEIVQMFIKIEEVCSDYIYIFDNIT